MCCNDEETNNYRGKLLNLDCFIQKYLEKGNGEH